MASPNPTAPVPARGPITSHILDTNRGAPAAGVAVILEKKLPDRDWEVVGSGTSNAEGRVNDIVAVNYEFETALYRMSFKTSIYFKRLGVEYLYPEVIVVFKADPAKGHYHIPLLLNPNSYTVYRGC